MGSITTAMGRVLSARRMSDGASWSMGLLFPRRFHTSMLARFDGSTPMAPYTSRKRCRQLALSSSRLT